MKGVGIECSARIMPGYAGKTGAFPMGLNPLSMSFFLQSAPRRLEFRFRVDSWRGGPENAPEFHRVGTRRKYEPT